MANSSSSNSKHQATCTLCGRVFTNTAAGLANGRSASANMARHRRTHRARFGYSGMGSEQPLYQVHSHGHDPRGACRQGCSH